MANVYGELIVAVDKGTELKNHVLFGSCNPYVLIRLRSSTDSKTTSVKDDEPNPVWQETFTFREVASGDALQISLLEKGPSREGVLSVAEEIRSTCWGFPGTRDSERAINVKFLHRLTPALREHLGAAVSSKADDELVEVGTIRIRLRYRATLAFRPVPFGLFEVAGGKTATLTERAGIDMAVGKALDVLCHGASIVNALNNTQKLAASGVAVAALGGMVVAGGLLAIPVAFFAVLFLPMTILGGFVTVMVGLMLLPIMMALAWVVLCSCPVQNQVWQPALFWAITKHAMVHKVLLKPTGTGKEQ